VSARHRRWDRATFAYNRRVSRAERRRAGVLTLVGLLGAGLVLALAPFDLASVRVRGVSLAWWYAGLVAPAAAVVTSTLLLLGRDR
jgi:hypothetical protein